MRIVVKVGTSTLAHATGRLNIQRMERLCRVLSDLKNAGHEGDYPEIVSKMVLLLGAGLGMRKVLERIAVDYRKNLALGGQKRFAYEEIVFTCQEMENGVSEQEAYQRMGMRMGTGAYRSLAVLLTQNLKKGSKGLLELLKQESQEAFEERRRQAKTTGEKASTKLLLPMGMMLAVVLVILTVPAFLSFYA